MGIKIDLAKNKKFIELVGAYEHAHQLTIFFRARVVARHEHLGIAQQFCEQVLYVLANGFSLCVVFLVIRHFDLIIRGDHY